MKTILGASRGKAGVKPVERDRYEASMPVKLLRDAPDNPRRELGDLGDLTQSIKARGVLQPIIVVPKGAEAYMVVAGHRRKAAAIEAGLTHVPCIVTHMTDEERLEAMLIENCQRSDLSPVEEARAFAKLGELGRSQRELAARLGKSQPHICKRLALLSLPEKVLAKVDSGGITLADANHLVKLAEHPKRIEKVLEGGGGNIAYNVDVQLKELRKAERIKTLKAECKKKGVTVLKSAHAYGFRPPEGVWRIGTGYGELPLDAKAHASLPCHAVGIDPWSGEGVPCCTDRQRHPGLQTKGEAMEGGEERRAARSKEQEQIDALEACEPRRRAAIVEVLRGARHQDLLEIAALREIDDADPMMIQEVAAYLSGESNVEDRGHEWAEALRVELAEHVRKSEVAAVRLIAACALIWTEDACMRTFHSWGPAAERHLAVLKRHGYQVSPAEDKQLTKGRKVSK